MAALRMGAVAYDPKVVTIWEGFRDWFAANDLDFDYVLYSNYERQVEALLAGEVDVAWNSPLAWVRARRLAGLRGPNAIARVEAVAMRDTDRDLTSVVIVLDDSVIDSVADLAGRRVGVGAVDSPQATLIPLWHLGQEGAQEVEVVHHDIGVGKHGDHIGGEREAALALLAGRVDAACMIDGNHLAFSREGTLAPGRTRILTETPPFDHCNFTVRERTEEIDRFRALLLSMSYEDPAVRPLLDMEGLTAWCDGRTSGYGPLEAAVTERGFYAEDGAVTAAGYRP
ncbi:MAG: phosphate/phosphite/phosphonate ABC transporter substrate-binding protein [Acidimicrobiales bacterium]